MKILSDEHIDLLGQLALTSPAKFADHMRGITGVTSGVSTASKARIRVDISAHAQIFSSQNAPQLLSLLDSGSVTDRLVACVRILEIPAVLMDPDRRLEIRVAAQAHLSHLLVRYPALMHNQIFIPSACFHKLGVAPAAFVIANAPGAELPRLTHGVGREQLAAFAGHPCVVGALTSPSPKLMEGDNVNLKGTFSEALFSFGRMTPKPRLLASLLLLDAFNQERGSVGVSLVAARKSSKSAEASAQALSNAMVEALLSECGLAGATRPNLGGGGAGYISALGASGSQHDPRFLRQLSIQAIRWGDIPANQQAAALIKLTESLLALAPKGVVSGEDAPARLQAVAWVVTAIISERRTFGGDFGEVRVQPAKATPESAEVLIRTLAEVLGGDAPLPTVAALVREAANPGSLASSQAWVAAANSVEMMGRIDALTWPDQGCEIERGATRARRPLSV